MKCELCHMHEACVEVKQIVNGHVREAHLCGDCASEKGLKSPEMLAELLLDGGLFPFAEASGDSDDVNAEAPALSCPGCHMSTADFRQTSRLGCEQCYATFAALLEPMIASMQRTGKHKGKCPAREAVHDELNGFRSRLKEAIRKEAYEEAAGLRDRIRVLELAQTCLDSVEPLPADGADRLGESDVGV